MSYTEGMYHCLLRLKVRACLPFTIHELEQRRDLETTFILHNGDWKRRFYYILGRITTNITYSINIIIFEILGLLPSMGWNKGEPSEPRCYFMEVIDMRYLATLYFTTILLPSALMAVVYCFIFKAVRDQVKLSLLARNLTMSSCWPKVILQEVNMR